MIKNNNSQINITSKTKKLNYISKISLAVALATTIESCGNHGMLRSDTKGEAEAKGAIERAREQAAEDARENALRDARNEVLRHAIALDDARGANDPAVYAKAKEEAAWAIAYNEALRNSRRS